MRFTNSLAAPPVSSVAPTCKALSLVLAVTMLALPSNAALAAGAWAPEQGDAAPEGEEKKAEEGDADKAEGEPAEGEEAKAPEGEEAKPDAEAAEGEPGEGEAAEGEPGEGEAAEGEPPPEEQPEEPPAEEKPPEEPAAAPEEPAVPEGPTRPPEPTYGNNKPLKGTGMLIAGGVVTGLGIAGVITTALITRNCSFSGPLQCKYRSQDRFLIPLTTAGTLTGVILMAVGASFRIKYKRWERWTPGKNAQLGPAVIPGGGGVTYAASF